MKNNKLESFTETESYHKNLYNRAENRLNEIKGFHKHLLAFILFTPFTIFINYKTYWDYKWFWYSIIPWGIAVAIHAFVVFVIRDKSVFGKNWEERKIEQFMNEEKENKKWD